MKQECDGWIVRTGGGFLIHQDKEGKLWNAYRDITVFTDIKEAISVQRKAKNMPLSRGKSYRYRVHIKRC